MVYPRVALLALAALVFALQFPASAQTVISTHSGTLYFFEGAVFIGEQQVEQKFGQFPDIGQGHQLWTKDGRAEVLLTPGVFLRVNKNSAIRLDSDQLSDTRVAVLDGSAILEVREIDANTSVTLTYKNWQLRGAQRGVYRVDSNPAQVRVYRGEIQVCAAGAKDGVTVRDGEELPFAPVLVAEQAPPAAPDDFKTWAMSRSMAIASDNATAAGILDDPGQIDADGLATGGFSYFPLTGVPSLGVGNPYGVSFWSPYQPALGSIYSYPSIWANPVYGYGVRAPYLGIGSRSFLPGRTTFPSRIGGAGTGIGMHPGGVNTYRPYAPSFIYRPPASPGISPVHPPVVRGIGHR
ncbi:MAG TPA: FecR domain-containing protein [Bryobacteraceae bacterium]|nr:FecR domain-containing protein [Bryobacteraceae bacterium]